MKAKNIVTSIVILLVLVGLYWVLVHKRDDKNANTSEPPSNTSAFSLTFKKPKWLEGHQKQDTIEEYINERRETILKSAIEFERKYPKSVALPFTLDITLERVIVGEYESILITDYEFAGGAHGMTKYVSYTLHNNKDISLTEYLKTKGISIGELLTQVNNRIKEDNYWLKDSLDNVIWQVHPPDKDNPIGIRLIFGPYEVASYSEGTIKYTF